MMIAPAAASTISECAVIWSYSARGIRGHVVVVGGEGISIREHVQAEVPVISLGAERIRDPREISLREQIWPLILRVRPI
jgi:hypothetical protein